MRAFRVEQPGQAGLVDLPPPAPGPGEVLVRVEASPVNPSDLGMMLGPAHTARFETVADAGRPEVAAQIPATHMAGVASRIGQPLPVGNEGAGTVVAAGAGAEAYLGKTVAMLGGSMYAQYRLIKAREVMVLPEGASAADGASCFVNPLTALGMVETMRSEGHTALVHTAAASNLGQMLNRICLKDGVSLVNVVRSPAQAAILKGEGARWVVDSSAPDSTDGLFNCSNSVRCRPAPSSSSPRSRRTKK